MKKIIITSVLRSLQCIWFFWGIISIPLVSNEGGAFAQSVGGTTSGAATYCTNSNSGLVTVTGYVGAVLNWQSTTDGGLTWNNNSNPTANQTYFNLNQTTCYRAIVKDGAFAPDTSTIVCITIFSQSVGGTILGGGTFCDSSGSGSLTLSGSAGNILYWQSSANGGATWLTIANTTITENYSNITQSTLYRAIVQSDPGCPKDTSNQLSFIIDSVTAAGTIIGDSTVCSVANSGTINLLGYTGTILGWESSINSGTNWTAISNSTATNAYLNISQDIWYRAIVKSGTCSADTSANFVIGVSPATLAGTISGDAIYCGVVATGTLTLSGETGTIIGWASSTNNGATYTAIANTSTTENYSNLAVTTWYVAIIQSGACPVDTSAIAKVTVAPQTVAGTISSSSIACLGSNIDTLLLSGNIGNVIGWIYSTNNGVTWNAIANTSTSQIYTGLLQTTMYAAIVQSGSCNIDTTGSVIITLVTPPIVNAGNDVSIIQNQSLQLNGSGTGAPMWSPASSLSNPASFVTTAKPNLTTTYILTVTDSNGCVSSDTLTITVIQSVFTGMVANLFTPDGDGINDNWHVEGIENFPDNEVFIYNIYGKGVFTKKAYANDWQGTYNGDQLPDGTYYYLIRFENSATVLKGSVDILKSK